MGRGHRLETVTGEKFPGGSGRLVARGGQSVVGAGALCHVELLASPGGRCPIRVEVTHKYEALRRLYWTQRDKGRPINSEHMTNLHHIFVREGRKR